MKKHRLAILAALALASYCVASSLDYRALAGQRDVPLPAVSPEKKEPLTAQQVERLVRYAMKVEGLDGRWTENDVDLMAALCWRESRRYPGCQNPRSSAYGLWQFLDSTWEGTRIQKTADPLLQTIAAVRYVKSRYKDPTRAYWHQVERNYY